MDKEMIGEFAHTIIAAVIAIIITAFLLGEFTFGIFRDTIARTVSSEEAVDYLSSEEIARYFVELR